MKAARLISIIVAMLTLGAFAAAPAFAELPEFWKGGAAIGANTAISFKATSVNGLKLRIRLQAELTCAAGTSAGATKGPKEITNVVIKFTTCKKGTGLGALTCTSPGAVAGEIKTASLRGVLVYITKVPVKVGVVFSAIGGGEIATYNCTGLLNQIIMGSVIGEVTPTGAENTEWNAIFAELNGHQQFEKYENEVVETHHMLTIPGAPCPGGLHVVYINTEKFEWEPAGEKVEIKA
jgi:hypothetical protein